MEICKTKAIQEDLDIFWHILTYSGINRHIQEQFGHIEAYLEPFVILAYLDPCIFRTRRYSEPIYIENPGIFSQSTVKHPRWSIFAIIVNGYNYFNNISFLRSTLRKKYDK